MFPPAHTCMCVQEETCIQAYSSMHMNSAHFKQCVLFRPVDKIRGLTRESVIEITTNIESQEIRRLENSTIGYEEHPRAATTDDVEAFFSICRRQLGQTFTLSEVESAWPKIVQYVY